MNEQNAAKVTKEVKVLTSDPDDMNEADAVLIADVIDSVVLLEDSLNEVKTRTENKWPNSGGANRNQTLWSKDGWKQQKSNQNRNGVDPSEKRTE